MRWTAQWASIWINDDASAVTNRGSSVMSQGMRSCGPLRWPSVSGAFQDAICIKQERERHGERRKPIANPFSRTPSAFAEFQATTRGTATQAIKALEAGGYLVRQPFKTDGRSVSLRLTSKGQKALARDPFEVLVRAVDSLDAQQRTAMRRALHQVLSTLATSRAHRRIGVCPDCTHFGREMCGNPPGTGASAAECLLLGVPIQPEDVGLLCVHFQPMNDHREDGRTP
jgi:DNA-binding MarR family transcriptional regulator